MFFQHVFAQAQPRQAPVEDSDGRFVQDLLQLRSLGPRQEAREAGLGQRDALLVVGLLGDLTRKKCREKYVGIFFCHFFKPKIKELYWVLLGKHTLD